MDIHKANYTKSTIDSKIIFSNDDHEAVGFQRDLDQIYMFVPPVTKVVACQVRYAPILKSHGLYLPTSY